MYRATHSVTNRTCQTKKHRLNNTRSDIVDGFLETSLNFGRIIRRAFIYYEFENDSACRPLCYVFMTKPQIFKGQGINFPGPENKQLLFFLLYCDIHCLVTLHYVTL